MSRGFTLMGLPTVSAHVAVSGQFGQLDSRLWDVGPDGKQTLISRGVYRLLDNQNASIVFQLHGNGWRFAAGHRPSSSCSAGTRPTRGRATARSRSRSSNVQVELPTLERPRAPPAARWWRPALAASGSSVRPRRPRAGRRVKLIFYAKISPAGHRVAVRGAKVHFAGHTRKTNRHGRATMR